MIGGVHNGSLVKRLAKRKMIVRSIMALNVLKIMRWTKHLFCYILCHQIVSARSISWNHECNNFSNLIKNWNKLTILALTPQQRSTWIRFIHSMILVLSVGGIVWHLTMHHIWGSIHRQIRWALTINPLTGKLTKIYFVDYPWKKFERNKHFTLFLIE